MKNYVELYDEGWVKLYNDGWRAEDKEQLMNVYELTEEEADDICEALADIDKKPINYTELGNVAADLYDGGWRAEDKEQLMGEYELIEEEADYICMRLAEYAENEGKEDDENDYVSRYANML